MAKKKIDPKTPQLDPALVALKDELFATAKKSGKIDEKDVFAKLADTPEHAEIIDVLYSELAEANIQLTAPGVPAAGLTDEWTAEDDEEIVLVHRYADSITLDRHRPRFTPRRDRGQLDDAARGPGRDRVPLHDHRGRGPGAR